MATDRLRCATGQLGRAVRAEITRSGGRRSILLFGAIPAAVLLPLIITLGVAMVSERFASISSTIQVTSVATTNSVYWVITFTVIAWAVIATFAQATGERGAVGEMSRYLYPRSATAALVRWIVYGAWAALCSALLVSAVMLLLPNVFPRVYAGVDIASAAGVRFIVTVPIYGVFAVGIGVGLAAIVGHPATSVAILLGWTYIVENAISLIPNGYTLQSYMPFLNGVYATGQELAFLPPWGVDGALAYVAAIATAVFVLGCGVLTLRRR
ncbi:ABC transporter permease [Gordonia sp. ABSL49_1]|uniref:ABC transporter permease n=1 Tax=Gordonia sp. ABSL49_1 TaxID=2920941 RepID=UPI001F0E9F01|nr:ABC transporter permease [Gordonia sp. ABSL49_1]MCH5644012.1 ABC transporter permease [Gordonia sp. ABSL49_1]